MRRTIHLTNSNSAKSTLFNSDISGNGELQALLIIVDNEEILEASYNGEILEAFYKGEILEGIYNGKILEAFYKGKF